ncbi:probable cytochrome P450 6a14 [Schistocerca gregaria]|uniref:probable cytochrome P450 6a14 n=1 Tax=Schistocerca gregaria TaxID=7010 RepID=UPI00211DDA04|nr:probable cytochrome P450 6a14 [Schistocerca gregaria]
MEGVEWCPRELVLSALAVLVVLWVCYYRHYIYWSTRDVPQLWPWTPFGNTRKSILGTQSFANDLDEMYQQFRDKRYVGIYRKRTPSLLVIDPELIRQVFVKDFDFFMDRERLPFKEPVLENQLFFMKGERWRHLRNKLSPLFTSGKLKNMFQTLNECGTEMVDVLSEAAQQCSVIEFREACALYTTEVIGSLAFGVKLNCQRNPDCDFRRWARALFRPQPPQIERTLMETFAPHIWKLLTYKAGRRDVFKYFDDMAKETLQQRLTSGTKRNDFMDLFTQLHTKGSVDGEKNGGEGWKLTEDEVAAQAFLFYTAGFETSSTTMSFAIYELAVNPDIQEHAQNEIDSVLAESGAVTYDALSKMKYLDKVLAETLRKYPPLTTINRETLRPYRLPSADGSGDTAVILDRGIIVVIPVHSIHHDPVHYPNPERFDPERFSDEAKASRHPFVYLPFGEGPRFCIGMRLGLLQAKLGLVHLLSNYTVDVSSETDIPLVLDPYTPVLSAQNGIRLCISKRKPPRTAQ